MDFLDKSDEEIIKIANPIWDDLVRASNNKDYSGFTKHFSAQMLYGANEVEIGKQWASNKLLTSLSEKKEAFTTAAFEWVLSRPPSKEEMSLSLKFLQAQEAQLAKGGTPFAGANAAKVPAAKDLTQRARENLVQVLFNHNDFVTIR